MKSISPLLSRLMLTATAFVLAACSTVTVTTDYDKATAFGKYRTYSLAPAANGRTLSPTSEAALRGSLRSSLAARGLTETSGRGNLSVVRHVFTQEKVEVNQYTDWGYGYGAWPYRYGYYGFWPGMPRTYTDVTQYTQGTLVLDFVDTKTGKLVFRGVGRAIVGSPETNARRIQEAVEKIVSAYPGGTQGAAVPR